MLKPKVVKAGRFGRTAVWVVKVPNGPDSIMYLRWTEAVAEAIAIAKNPSGKRWIPMFS